MLIPVERATELVPNFPPADVPVMADLVTAASDFTERYCARTFSVASYDELYDGQGAANLLLNQYPVVSIDRINFNRTPVVMLRMTDQAASRATFRLDSSTGTALLILTKVASGVTSTNALTLATYPTLADLATAITAVGSGWTATALGVYAGYPTADLRSPQGGFDCRWQGSAYLRLHVFEMPAFEINPAVGEIVCPFGFTRGYQNYRVLYTAGFADGAGNTLVPSPVQQAVAELASAAYLARSLNPNLASENLGGWSYSNLVDKTFKSLSHIAGMLDLYRSRRIAKTKVF